MCFRLAPKTNLIQDEITLWNKWESETDKSHVDTFCANTGQIFNNRIYMLINLPWHDNDSGTYWQITTRLNLDEEANRKVLPKHVIISTFHPPPTPLPVNGKPRCWWAKEAVAAQEGKCLYQHCLCVGERKRNRRKICSSMADWLVICRERSALTGWREVSSSAAAAAGGKAQSKYFQIIFPTFFTRLLMFAKLKFKFVFIKESMFNPRKYVTGVHSDAKWRKSSENYWFFILFGRQLIKSLVL